MTLLWLVDVMVDYSLYSIVTKREDVGNRTLVHEHDKCFGKESTSTYWFNLKGSNCIGCLKTQYKICNTYRCWLILINNHNPYYTSYYETPIYLSRERGPYPNYWAKLHENFVLLENSIRWNYLVILFFKLINILPSLSGHRKIAATKEIFCVCFFVHHLGGFITPTRLL